MAFGMYSTDNTVGSRSLKSRRKIFWQYPSGAAPLMGLLSYLPSEETDKVEFGQYERRFPTQKTTTVATGTAPFLNGDGTAFTDTGTMTANTEYIVKVLTTAEFKPTHVIELREIVYTAGAVKSIKGTVTEIVSSTQIKFRPYTTTAGVENGTTGEGLFRPLDDHPNRRGDVHRIGAVSVGRSFSVIDREFGAVV